MKPAVSNVLIHERRELNAIVSACQRMVNTPACQQDEQKQEPYKRILKKVNTLSKQGDFGFDKDTLDAQHLAKLEIVGGEIDSLYTALKDAYNDNRKETIYKDLGINLISHIRGQHALSKPQKTQQRPIIELRDADNDSHNYSISD